MKRAIVKYAAFAAIALLAAAATLFLYRGVSPFVQQLDLRLKDARVRLRGEERTRAPVAIVTVDNRSVKEVGRWPWSREQTARLIDAIAAQGARVIALDMVFAEPQAKAPDTALAQSVAGAGTVVLGFFFRDEAGLIDPAVREQLARSRVASLTLAPGVTTVPVPEQPGVEANLAAIGRGGAGFGYFNQLPDGDGLYRSLPLLMLYDGDLYPALALAAVSRFLGAPVQVRVEPYGVASVQLGQLSIPVDEHGRQPLAWYGTGGTITTLSAADLLAGRLPAGTLKDRLVFVGVTEPGIADLRATPLDGVLPGVEISATFAANALEGRFLTRDGRTLGVEMAAIFLLPLLLGLALAATPGTLWGLAAFVTTAGGYLWLNFHLFAVRRIDLSIAYPLLALLLAYLGGEAFRNLVVERRGRYLKRAFASYLSPDLVAEIMKDPARLRLGGEKREITVLFSDIRGFTSISEGLPPEELVALLNRYLSPMTRIVMEERGTLDKFVGDAIMALFNAPLPVPDHPARACRSALRMVEELGRLNAEFEAQGLPLLRIGVGIHTGDAVVGNMGADIRFDYTAIGDTVNLASRLEGQNKQYGTTILVSGDARASAGEGFHFRELDLVRVKGKEQPVALHELCTAPYPEQVEFDRALASYRAGRFADAAVTFERLATDHSDPVSRMYADRCRAYADAPPPAGWAGVYVAREK
jgi:adenylate cyclase